MVSNKVLGGMSGESSGSKVLRSSLRSGGAGAGINALGFGGPTGGMF
jgi:hypothetical protein